MVAYAFVLGLDLDGAYAASDGSATLDIITRRSATTGRILLNWLLQISSGWSSSSLCLGDADVDDATGHLEFGTAEELLVDSMVQVFITQAATPQAAHSLEVRGTGL
jgi:hypothetical protein